MEAAIFIYLFISPSKMFAKFNVCANFGLSLVRLDSNCCSSFLKMVLLSLFRNRIEAGDHWTLKILFKKILSLMDVILSLRWSSYHSTLSSPWFVTVTAQFYFILQVKRHYNLFLWGYVYVIMYACRYVSM